MLKLIARFGEHFSN